MPTHLVPTVWPLVEAWIVKALDKGHADETPARVRWQLMHNAMELFLAWDGTQAHGCWIIEFAETARGRCCHLYLVSGRDFKTWRHLLADIKAYALANGCNRIEAGGRPGWARLVARDGFKRLRVILELRLDNAE